jgi:hypothetical protein
MNTIQISIPQPKPVAPPEMLLSVPVAIPALADVIQFAKALHVAGQPWEGTVFGWPADYTPEIKEENALFEEYDENGTVQTVRAPRWSPAIFCIGINDLWFVSLTWELGADAEPWVYCEDDYGYDFDEAPQIALAKARLHASP